MKTKRRYAAKLPMATGAMNTTALMGAVAWIKWPVALGDAGSVKWPDRLGD